MEILPSPSPAQIAREVRAKMALFPKPSPREFFIEMVREGRINGRGELTNLFGGEAEPEPNRETWLPPESPVVTQP